MITHLTPLSVPVISPKLHTILSQFDDGDLGSGCAAEWMLATRLHAHEIAITREIERRRRSKTLVGVAAQGWVG